MKNVFIERNLNLIRIAIKEENRLKECFIEEENSEPYPGQIYKGRVKNIVPAIKCAFIDIGKSKSAYMYLDNKFNNLNIKKGQEVLVEVVKESIGKKGPKVTNAISVPGRYSVVITLNNAINFSKKILDETVTEELKGKIKKGNDVGVMIRTNALNVEVEEINKEIEDLEAIYKKIIQKFTYSNKPEMLFDAGGVIERVLRDNVNQYTDSIVVNDKNDYEKIKNFIESKEDIDTNVDLYTGERNLFDHYSIEKEILKLRNNKVMLKCGGYIVIDKTEAMYVIDVNSGKNIKNSSLRKTAIITNLEAAEEISKQIRLRNLSGIVLVDFIDLKEKDDKRKVLNKLEEGFKCDKNKTVIYPFTELNLVQIARRRRGKSIYDYMEEECEKCKGRGTKLKLSYIELLIRNEVIRLTSEQDINEIHIILDAHYKNMVNKDLINFIEAIRANDKTIYLNFENNIDTFKIEPIIFENQRKSMEQFRVFG